MSPRIMFCLLYTSALRITAGLARFFLAQGIRVSCYGNGLDCVDGEPVVIGPSAGSGQMERIYKALARVDTSRPAACFAEQFKDRLLLEAQGTMTLFVAPNAYEDFTAVVEEYIGSGQECVWYYPAWDKEDPQLPETVKKRMKMISVRK